VLQALTMPTAQPVPPDRKDRKVTLLPMELTAPCADRATARPRF
jgi:hypothetical protein